jgi:hypothetical protein
MKFVVIYLDLEEADCTILSVHLDYKNALEALNLALDGNHHNLSHFAESCKISKKLQQIQQFVYFT